MRSAIAKNHQQCVENVRGRMLSGTEPEHHRICTGLTEQVHQCGEHFEDCMDQEELRYVKTRWTLDKLQASSRIELTMNAETAV